MLPVARPFFVAAGVCLPLLLVAAGTARAQITENEASCRADLVKSFGKAVRAAQRAVTECHKLARQGEIGGSDCNRPLEADFHTGRKLEQAVAKLAETIESGCSDAASVLAEFARCPSPGSGSDDGPPTSGIDSWDELSSCLPSLLYGVLGDAAEAALGDPDGPLDGDARRCHGAIAKSLGKVVDTTFRERARCQLALDKAGGPIGFECATADPSGKIGAAIDKALLKIESACADGAAQVDSCATTAAGIADCAIGEHVSSAAGGLAALAWELPGVCPSSIAMRFEYDLDEAETDLGWTGHHHDAAPGGEYDAAVYSLSCDADCTSCGGAPEPPADHCRCGGDASVTCSTNTDCADPGGSCECYLSPPVHVSASSTPYCVLTPIESPMSGSISTAYGPAELEVELRQRTYYGTGLAQPCPVCLGNVCEGGARDGLACTVDAVDFSFGNTSFDCPPLAGLNLTGQGTPQSVRLAVEHVSLAASLPCDAPYTSSSCPCSSCSLDNSVACTSDADCSTAGIGVCRTDGLHDGTTRRANSCEDGLCWSDSHASYEGLCTDDDDSNDDRFCNGLLQANGRGVIACGNNADCEAYDLACPSGDCGDCTVVQVRECFLDPIEAGAEFGVLGGVGCMVATNKPSLNSVLGLPGPWRTRQPFSLHRPMCPDGVTPFDAPGGSNCP